ncbi:TadE/TadG family type IV pilus assembly protein [Acidocella sp.]|uniref:TadE/TadG family type IV pilus assembly protein n=1 Tax=Acidocella sp. TaxID=50710 RepID=UPI00261BD09C|nr:pilus assembly protein TadG-related protein [Acidocella sp.]
MMSLLAKFRKDRRAVTAMVLALMIVPLVVGATAAVDISRIASTRAELQAAADAAAIAGAGAWQTSQQASAAHNAATAAYSGTASTIANFVSSPSSAVELTCTGSSTQCGPTSPNTYATSISTYNCPASTEYCVIVTASGRLANSLISYVIPSELLTVSAMATTSFPATTISGKNIPPSPGFGSAGDVSGIYAYAVPMSGTGAGATPDYTTMPSAGTNCGNYASVGPLALEETVASSTCNYLFIALSTSSGTAGAGGSISLQQNQPIAFTFVNYTGANGYHSSGYYKTNTQLYVNTDSTSNSLGTYYQNGDTVTYSSTLYTTNVYYCQQLNDSGNCDTSGSPSGTYTSSSGPTGTQTYCIQGWWSCYQYETDVTTSSQVSHSVKLYGQCPAHTLYGSLDPISVDTTTGVASGGGPSVDSINVYSSAYEVVGYPPTFETNHALVPFVATGLVKSESVNGTTYHVTAICPNYATSGTDQAGTSYSTNINALIYATYAGDIASTLANQGGDGAVWQGLNIYSTAFPGQTYTDGGTAYPPYDSTGLYTSSSIEMVSGSNDIYPPAIAGCTPAINAQDNGVTTTPSNWWNWNGSNSGSCSDESSAHQSSYLTAAQSNSSGTTVGQPQYSNCTLLIQPLGTAVPTNQNNQALLPDYYILVSTAANGGGTVLAIDPVWDGKTFTDLIPGVMSSLVANYVDGNISISNGKVVDKDTAATYNSSGGLTSNGFVPNYYQSFYITSGAYKGDYGYFEPPSHSGNEFDPPDQTSHQCYDPQKNGNAAHTVAIQNGTSQPTIFTAQNDQNDNEAIDAIANPQDGAIICDSNPPETYALYWNDLGTYGSDDLGYWNAVMAFTCSVPGTGTTGGGPVTLSG